MSLVWSVWKLFPTEFSRIALDAPAGPGLFEVRHVSTGEPIAFAASPDVAASLMTLIQPPASGLRSIFARQRVHYRPGDLEFRTCATSSIKEARAEEDRLNGRRRAYLQRRKAAGWA
ncbi:hypothetical protein [Pseudorhodoplanes sp.]|jgi:hypothetical protein|uniref:hypothetical protein n=1 Tax=Pseudorhodoplanes sp. TaxID=1934341 RepID=UPI002C13F11B|nr:hypothetical protein [Pseudorhodoplanes sp.]HWV41883.1 hypothetical protein [Pseudorhodoplanes sp.]